VLLAPGPVPRAGGLLVLGCNRSLTADGTWLVESCAAAASMRPALPASRLGQTSSGTRESLIRRFQQVCKNCGCANKRELARLLAKDSKQRRCPMTRRLPAGQLGMGDTAAPGRRRAKLLAVSCCRLLSLRVRDRRACAGRAAHDSGGVMFVRVREPAWHGLRVAIRVCPIRRRRSRAVAVTVLPSVPGLFTYTVSRTLSGLRIQLQSSAADIFPGAAAQAGPGFPPPAN
jgi:hypothetical protein